MSPRTGVGIVGCGVISDVYAAKLSALPDVQVGACADLVAERARELAAKHGIPLALEPEKLPRHPDVEIVLNLTIPAVHARIAADALAAGKSVYGEKPLALQLADGVRLLEQARALRAGRSQRASGELACHVLELMELAIAASDSGRHRNTTTRCERPAPLAPGLPDDVFEPS